MPDHLGASAESCLGGWSRCGRRALRGGVLFCRDVGGASRPRAPPPDVAARPTRDRAPGRSARARACGWSFVKMVSEAVNPRVWPTRPAPPRRRGLPPGAVGRDDRAVREAGSFHHPPPRLSQTNRQGWVEIDGSASEEHSRSVRDAAPSISNRLSIPRNDRRDPGARLTTRTQRATRPIAHHGRRRAGLPAERSARSLSLQGSHRRYSPHRRR